jgi:hypothetical protein
MNTLTSNRILQKGDEYRDNGTWKPVPKNDFGLQIQFTDYKEVRRPAETPFPSPDKPESGRETTLEQVNGMNERFGPPDASYLPTVVSKKAHGLPTVDERAKELAALRETPETDNDSRTEQAKPPVSPTPLVISASVSGPFRIKFKDITHDHPDRPIWTGRNGTFTGYGLEVMKVNTNAMLSPIGKRGVGNCAIQVPLASVPDLINDLQKLLK